MPYQVKFTEITNPAKPSITVADQTLNQETSLVFPGKNYSGYAPVMAENFLHLLENFANNSEPTNPIEGQLWYDNSTGVNLLKVYDGTNWTAAGSVKKAGDAPAVANSTKGDLWVDTSNQQLYIFSGSNWLLVGPQYSAGLLTGPVVETVVDTNDITHSIVSMYAENYRISIISKAYFTPKAAIDGFAEIKQGVNLSTVDKTSSTAPTKFWGTASQADALVVNNSTVLATNFLRSDQPSIANYPLSVRASGGISLGSDLSFNISVETSSTILYSKNSGSSIDIKLNSAGVASTVLHVDARNRVGIGQNNTNPSEALDVLGSAIISGRLIVTGTNDPSPGVLGREASITTAGGLNVDKTATFGDDITAFGGIHLNNLTVGGDPIPGTVIQPGSDSATETYDIGSSTRKFRNVYAKTFVGNFSGSFTGALTGSISGTAVALASPTPFKLEGDVSSNTINFNGQNQTATFTTTINQDIITARTETTESLPTDELLVYRTGSGLAGGLRKLTKQAFVSNLPTMPIGAILPYAGTTPPTGYLFCDGSEVRISDYSSLYAIVGYTYKTPSLLIGKSTFALPDLRGRFGLGRDDMDNNLTVPSKTNETILIDAGGGAANRVSDVTADTVGSYSGSESKTLGVTNLPEHRHTLNSGQAQYYASGLPSAPSDPNGVPNTGMPLTSVGSGLPNSGGVDSARLGVAFNVMNPYQTINYIIFTGVI